MKIVIFCGGFGTRMWPASTKSFPKQFRPIVKGKSFFRRTFERFEKHFDPTDIMVSTEEKYKNFITDQAPEIPVENIILEPERRDSLGAVGLVAAIVEKRFPKEVMFFSWSDHFIGKVDEFINAVKAAGEYTQRTGVSVSLNERPTYASVHNGWVEYGEKAGEEGGYEIFRITRHIEKPDQKTADEFFKKDNLLIHTGYASWKSDLLLGYYQQYSPATYESLVKIMDSWGTEKYEEVLNTEYHKIDKDSVEYGLFEKLPDDLRLTMATETEWEDAGTWQLFYKAMIEKGQDSVIEGEKMISLVGMKNVVVIDTHGALLVCNMDETAKVKEMFKKLEEEDPEFID